MKKIAIVNGPNLDRLGKRDPAWRLRIVAVAFVAVAPLWVIALLAAHPGAVIASLAIPAAVLCLYLAPTFAAVQSLADPAMRALAAALLLLVGTLIGLDLGPLVIGLTAGASTPNNKIGEAIERVLVTRGIELPGPAEA